MRIDVLIIDDDPDIRETLAELLQEEGYAVVALPDADELVETLEQAQPRLILLDLTLPGQDLGYILGRARDRELLTETVVLALSGLEEAGAVARQLGLQGFVGKPFQIVQLLEHVRRVCRADAGVENGLNVNL